MPELLKLDARELKNYAQKLHIGDKLLLSGYVYTARDAAHKRIAELMDSGKPTPFPIQNSVIYYAGPTPSPPGKVIGACGPTTSGRMDPYAPKLLDSGLAAMIGKGERSLAVREAIVRNKAVYLCAIGGAGALAAKCVKQLEVIAFDDLGCESVKRLYLENFPLVVCNDAYGGDLFSQGRMTYAK